MPGYSNASNLKIVQTTGQDQNAVMSQDAVTDELNTKIDVAQGSQNEGKVLGINSSGNVTPVDAPGGMEVTFI